MKLFFLTLIFILFLGCSSKKAYELYEPQRSINQMGTDAQLETDLMRRLIAQNPLNVSDIQVFSYYDHVYVIGVYQHTLQKEKVLEISTQFVSGEKSQGDKEGESGIKTNEIANRKPLNASVETYRYSMPKERTLENNLTLFLKPSKKEPCRFGKKPTALIALEQMLYEKFDVYGDDLHVLSVECNIVLLGVVPTKPDIDKAITMVKSHTESDPVYSFLVAKEEL